MYAANSILPRRRSLHRVARRWTVMLILALLVGVTASLILHGRASSAEYAAPARITVHSGDTLWEIASAHAPAGADIREVVFRIRRANNLRTSVLQPGQVIVIPVR